MFFMESLLVLILGFAGGSYVAQNQLEQQKQEQQKQHIESPYGVISPGASGIQKSEILQLMEACSDICGRDRVKGFDIKYGNCTCTDQK